jgi:hypothetical protein
MILNRSANLAAFGLVFLLIATGPLQLPLKVKFQLTDGVRLSGELTSWDRDGFDGTFGRRLWTELETDDLWKLYQRVMDPGSGDQWIDLGRVMLQIVHRDRRADELAERAFARAIRIDESLQARLDEVRQEVQRLDRQRRENEKKAEQAKLKTISPEGDPWRADPWPVLSDAEHNVAVLAMRSDAQQRMQQLALGFVPVESEHFLIYSDLPRTESAELAIRLEKACEAVRAVMRPTELHQPPAGGGAAAAPQWFWGKAVVFVFQKQDQFRLMEVESFNQLVSQSTIAMCHPVGPKVFLTAHAQGKGDDEELFNWTLMNCTHQGILHGYRTPRRLPGWANDGLAEYLTALVLRDSNLAPIRRRQALDFIRTGGSVNALMDCSYAEQTWPGPNQIGFPVGGLMIELLMKERHLRLIEWVTAVKQGDDWQESLRKTVGINRQSLVETFTQYYKVND